jgi:hypothetical protein
LLNFFEFFLPDIKFDPGFINNNTPMKKSSKFLTLLLAVSLFAIAESKAQVYVSKIPVVPKYKQPPRLSENYVWVTDEWLPAGKRYEYVKGNWHFRPTATAVWIDGYWRKEAKGYVRVPGHWDYNPKK